MLCPNPFECAFVLALLSFSSSQGLVMMANARSRRQVSALVFSVDFGVWVCPRDSCRLMLFDELFSYGVHISVAVRLALARVSCLG
jgi:hypothetical protein